MPKMISLIEKNLNHPQSFAHYLSSTINTLSIASFDKRLHSGTGKPLFQTFKLFRRNFSLYTILTFALGLLPLTSAANWPKRGLPFHNPPELIHKYNGAGSQVNWAYNWDSYMDPGFPKYLEFVPMIWGNGSDHTKNWFKNANNALSRGTGHLLAFNEPDACFWGASCMSPQAAVEAYRTYLMPFANRASLGAPAVTNGGSGLPWLKEFLRLCTGCKIDFVPIHWYDSASNDAYLKLYVNQAYKAAGEREIWITEFNARGTKGQQIAFLLKVMPWLDKQPFVFRYSWFWADPKYEGGTLVRANGDPTDLGFVFGYTPYGQV